MASAVLLLITAVLGLNGLVTLVGLAVLTADSGVPRRADARHLALFARETGIRSIVVLLAPLGFGQPAPDRGPVGSGGPPVLLVHGYRHNRAALTFLRAFLRQRGFAWVWPVNVGSPDRSLAELAATLGERVDALCRASGAPQVDIVAHSLGGLVAAWYVRHQGGAGKVHRLVTLGTPWGGTKVAVFGRGKVCREIGVGAPELDALAPPLVPTIAVWSDDDPLVVPSRSGLPDGAESVKVEACGHVEMLASARVFRAVQAALAPGAPVVGPSVAPVPEPAP